MKRTKDVAGLFAFVFVFFFDSHLLGVCFVVVTAKVWPPPDDRFGLGDARSAAHAARWIRVIHWAAWQRYPGLR